MDANGTPKTCKIHLTVDLTWVQLHFSSMVVGAGKPQEQSSRVE